MHTICGFGRALLDWGERIHCFCAPVPFRWLILKMRGPPKLRSNVPIVKHRRGNTTQSRLPIIPTHVPKALDCGVQGIGTFRRGGSQIGDRLSWPMRVSTFCVDKYLRGLERNEPRMAVIVTVTSPPPRPPQLCVLSRVRSSSAYSIEHRCREGIGGRGRSGGHGARGAGAMSTKQNACQTRNDRH